MQAVNGWDDRERNTAVHLVNVRAGGQQSVVKNGM